MKVVFATGSHPRHGAMARRLAETGHLAGLLVERREEFIPTPPENIDENLKELFRFHFAERERVESEMFSEWNPEALGVPLLEVSQEELNAEATHAFLRGHGPDLFLSYGVHKLNPQTLAVLEGRKWNIHGGLSPWYRGVITLFWPSYLLEPQMTGMTVHELTEDIDGGPVVHQVGALLVRGDGVQDLAGRAVQALVEELPRLVEIVTANEVKPPREPRTSGRIWRNQDWRPEHLRIVYELYRNRVVDSQLDGQLGSHLPQLFRQFESDE